MKLKRPTSSPRLQSVLGPPQAVLDESAFQERREDPVMGYVDGDRIYRKAIRFLACRDKSNAANALRVWKKFRGMLDAGSDYDEEASEFVTTLLDVIGDLNPDIDPTFGLTRDELRGRDLDVAQAAKAFVVALDNHASLEFHGRRWCRPIARRDSPVTPSRIATLEDLRHHAVDLALASPPTPRQVALRIERRARELAATRMGHKKSRQTEIKKTLLRRNFERGLIETLHARYSNATPNRIAEVVSPIVEHLFDTPESFDRCRNYARDLIKADKKGGG